MKLLLLLLAVSAFGQYFPPTLPSPAFVQTATVTVTGTTMATTLTGTGTGSLTLPANFFQNPGDTLHVKYRGTMSPGNSATTYTLTLKLGSTTIATGTATPSANALTYGCIGDIIIVARTIGSSGTVLATGQGWTCSSSDDSTNDTPAFTSTSPVTIDTTSAKLFDLQITPGNSAQTFSNTFLRLTRQ